MATTLSPGIQYVGSQLQYVSPTGQILPVSAAPSTPSGSGTTNNATVPTPSQVTFNPAALPPKLSPGIQYVGSSLQYVSPTGQILPVSAAPSTPSGSSTTTLAQLAANQAAITALATQGAAQAKTQLAGALADQASQIASNTALAKTLGATVDATGNITPPAGGYTASGLVTSGSGTPPTPPTVQNSFQNPDGTITIVYSDGTTSIIGTPTPKGPSTADQSALGAITDILGQAGLGSLVTAAWGQLNAGVPASQIISDIRSGTNPIYGDAYAKRFPGMAALAAKGQAINEGTYINLENSYIQELKSSGIPSGTFDTTAYLGSLIANNINPQDFQNRLNAAQNSVLSLDPNIKQYALDTYGLDAGHLAAWALDPSQALPKIQQQAQAMQIGGAALQQGFKGVGANGELTTTQAETLANQGISQAQAQAGFNNLAQETQFETQLPGDVATALTNQQLINSQFKSNGADQLAFQRLQQQKVNEFNAGGAIQADQSGVKGIGASNLTA